VHTSSVLLPDPGNVACCRWPPRQPNQPVTPHASRARPAWPNQVPTAFNAGRVSGPPDSSAPSCAWAAQQKPARGREAFFRLAVAAGRAAPDPSAPHDRSDRSAGRRGCDRVEAARMPARRATEVSYRVKEETR